MTVMLIPNGALNFGPVAVSPVVRTSAFSLSSQTALWDRRLPWAPSKGYAAPFSTFHGLRSEAVPPAQLHFKVAPFVLLCTQLSCQSNTETQDKDQKTRKAERGCAAGLHRPSLSTRPPGRGSRHSDQSPTVKVP